MLKAIVGTVAVLCTVQAFAQSTEVNVYSARKEALIKPVLDDFTAETGIKVNLITGKADALISRIASEAQFSPADVILTTDVGRLHRAKSMDLLQAFDSSVLKNDVPANFQDKSGFWYGLTMRARPIMYHPDRVKPEELSGVLDLADPKWKGRVCIRSSNNIYNQSLVATMIDKHGEETVQKWANDFVKNFARKPKGGDRDQIKAVVAGECDVAVANSYYLAGMLADSDSANAEIAKQVKIHWPDQESSGAHVNISGAAIAKHAPNVNAARQLVNYLIRPASQKWYAEHNHEYPVLAGVEKSDILTSFGEFNAENVDLEQVGVLNATAVRIMDKAGWK